MSMFGTRQRLLAGVATIAIAAVGVAFVAVAAMWPLPEAREPESPFAGGVAVTPRVGETLPLTSFAQAWDVPLRRPLTDTTISAAAAPGAASDIGSSIRLVGTIVDPARPRGIFVTNLGQMELRGVGEKAGGAEVLRVDERSATVLLAGRQVTLKVEKLESILTPAPPVGDPAAQPSADASKGQR